MTSSHRDLKNFKIYEGRINTSTGNYEYPTLYSHSSKKQVRIWKICVRLIKEGTASPKKTDINDWNEMEEIQVSIKDEHFDNLPEGTVSQYWTETGIMGGKISRHPPTYPVEKNKGKKNERNYLHQALVETRSKYLKKINQGFKHDYEDENLPWIKMPNKKYHALQAKNYKDVKDKVKYPVYVQPKLDGLRCLFYYDPTQKNVVMYSRDRKDFPHNDTNKLLIDEIKNVLKDYYDGESIYLDGELYSHGISLQEINSIVRKSDAELQTIKYNCFDVFYPSKDLKFKQRLTILNSLQKYKFDYIEVVPTHLINDEKELDNIYKYYITAKYEGIMLRKLDSVYPKCMTKTSKLRTMDLIKRKEVYEGEFEIVDFTTGKSGRDKNTIIWIMKTDNNKLFNVVPLGTTQYKKQLLKNSESHKGKGFIQNYKGRLLNVEYRGLSDDNVPQHAKGISFRDDIH